MAKKKKTTKKSKPSAGKPLKDSVVSKGKELLMGKSSSSGGRKKRKSALWYAKEIQRIKLKRKYERIKYAVR